MKQDLVNQCLAITPDQISAAITQLFMFYLAFKAALFVLGFIYRQFIKPEQTQTEFIDSIIFRMSGWYDEKHQDWLDAGYKVEGEKE